MEQRYQASGLYREDRLEMRLKEKADDNLSRASLAVAFELAVAGGCRLHSNQLNALFDAYFALPVRLDEFRALRDST